LYFMNSVLPRRAVTFLVSDFMADTYETPLRIASGRHDLIAIVVEDPREADLPDVGLMAVRDAESGHEVLVDTGDRKVRETYRRHAVERRRQRDETLRRTRADAIHVSTDRPYAEALYRFFRMRERRLA
jgi:uncharacterized protein (DUF58 family)